MIKRNKAAIIGSALVSAAVLGVGVWYSFSRNSGDLFSGCYNSKIAGGSAAIGGPFSLVDQSGKQVTDADVFSQPALVYFGYTFCPDVCPLDVARNAEAIDILQEQGFNIRPVFISIDPERDTPDVLAEYTSYMHVDMVGLTGSPEQVKIASLAFKTYFRKQETGDEFYLMDHSTFSYLMLPETGFAEFFKREDTAEELAQKASCFLTASG